MNFVEKLNQWIETQRKHGNLIDIKLFPSEEDLNVSAEKRAKIIYKIVTEKILSEPLDTSSL